MKSIWSNEYGSIPYTRELHKDIGTEVLIIGGGMAGVLCAYQLTQKGVKCVLVEKGRICGGNTHNTTAKITVQHGLIYDQLIRRFGMEKARQYYDINNEALKEFRRFSGSYPCDFEEQTAYVYSSENLRKLEKEADAYNRLSIPYVWKDHANLPGAEAAAVGIPVQGQFHPLKLVKQLLPEIHYYENTFVTDIEGNKAKTKYGEITAKHIILATHYPMVNIPGLYFMKLIQQRSYVLALEGAAAIDGMYIGERKDKFSFRNYGNLLLLGGGGHKTGKKGTAWQPLISFAKSHYPDAKKRYMWAAQDCEPLDHVPYIGRHRRRTSNLYVATGFNKWGMTGSMTAALVLTELITSGKSSYEALFSPQRTILRPKLVGNMAAAAWNLITPGRRCTHMGCSLTWNQYENSWDCPCHGSRFSRDGVILDNPAMRGILK